nr:oligosaccharide flippase family protein [uncultured Anaerostipes sp.]
MNKAIGLVKEKINSLSMPARASIVFAICSFVQKGISFCVIPIYTRIMAQEQYGYYTTFISWMSIISVIATLNLSYHVYYNGLMKYKNEVDEYTSSMLGLSAVITVTVFSIYMIGRGFFNQILGFSTIYMVFMFLEILLQPSFEFWAAYQRFIYSYKKLSFLTLLLAVIVPIISVPAVLLVAEESKGIVAVMCKVIVTCTIYFIPFIYLLRKRKSLYNREYWKFALRFNLPLIPHFLSAILLQQCDRVMINRFCGSASVAMYSVAFSMSTIITLVNTAILNSFTPWTYQAMEKKEFTKIKVSSKSICLLVSVVNMLIIFVAPDIIGIVAPPSYLEGMYVMVPLVVSVYFMFVVNLYVNIEYYYAQVKFVTFGSVGAVLVNIILNYIYIPKYGYIAAGYTTLASYMTYCFGHFLISSFLLRKKGVSPSEVYDSKIVLFYGVVLMIVSILCSMIFDMPIVRYSLLLVVLLGAFILRKRIITTMKTIRNK